MLRPQLEAAADRIRSAQRVGQIAESVDAQVATELPPRTEQTILCDLEPEDRALYDGLRRHYRQTLLARVNREGMGILLVEQNANQALGIADYGYVLEGGRFVLEGSAEELRANENVQEFYLGVRAEEDDNRLHVRRRRRRWN